MHVHSPICHGQLKEKRLTNSFDSLGAKEGGKKCLKKGPKKYQSVTHVSTCIFLGIFKFIVLDL